MTDPFDDEPGEEPGDEPDEPQPDDVAAVDPEAGEDDPQEPGEDVRSAPIPPDAI